MPLIRKTSSTASTSDGNNANVKVLLSGWMKKQKMTFKSWPRRYFSLTSNNVLAYYDSEDTSIAPRGVLQVVDVHPLTTENNGLLLQLANGKEEKLICDTHVAYSAWYSMLSRAFVKKEDDNNSEHSSSSSSSAISAASAGKRGCVHYQCPEGNWLRYYCVVEKETLNCYEKEDMNDLQLSGIIRSVESWDGKKYGLIVGLNKGRKIHLCFDSTEEKTNWILTFEFALKIAYRNIKQISQKQMILATHSDSYDLDQEIEDDDGNREPEVKAESNQIELTNNNHNRDDDDDDDDDGVWI